MARDVAIKEEREVRNQIVKCESFFKSFSFDHLRVLQASMVMCFGLTLCYFFFSMHLGHKHHKTVLKMSLRRFFGPRLQLLCMNPLQGVPKHLALPVLLDLRRRLLHKVGAYFE